MKKSILAIHIALASLGCWAQPGGQQGMGDAGYPSTHSTKSSKQATPGLVSQPIQKAEMLNSTALDYDGAYWRIYVKLGNPNGTLISLGDPRSVGQILLDKIKAAFWKSGEELMVSLRPIVDGVAAGPPVIVVHLKADGTASESSVLQTDAAAVSQLYLTAPMKVPNTADIQVTVVRVKSAETKALTALADLAALATPFNVLFKTGLPLTVARQTTLRDEGGKIEDSIKALLSSSNTSAPVPIGFNPLPSPASKAWVEELHLYNGVTDTPESRLLTLYNLKLESLLGTNNLLSGIPADATDIRAKPFVMDQANVATPLQEVIRVQIPDLYAAALIDTPDKVQEFCRTAHGQLSSKLGLERYDRTAVIWAYLKTSSWARRGAARPEPDADNCMDALSLAGKDKLVKLQIPVSPKEDPNIGREQLWAQSEVYRGTDKAGGLIPIAIQKGDAAAWTPMFGDTVVLSTIRKKMLLGGKQLDPGDSITRTGAQAAAMLKDTPLVWITSAKGKPACFNKADPQTTRRAFTATGVCMQLKSAGDMIDLPTEFVIEQTTSPTDTAKIVEIRFFPD